MKTGVNTEIGSLYDVLKSIGAEMDNHESDLYVKRTEQTAEIVNAYYHRGDIATVSTFKSQIDGCMWMDVPFAYLPYWEAKQRAKVQP